nr:DUF4245 family protein [Microbacterium lemovicicum]
MARPPRIVAELGRPETPGEQADRKAASSRVYRSSQTARNLIAALLLTLAVVAVVIFAVPRGGPPPRPSIDVAAVAADLGTSRGRVVIAPVVPVDWRVNVAEIEGGDVEAWTVVYVPGEDAGYLRVAQGFDADAGWPGRTLTGGRPDGTVEYGGVTWDRYRFDDSGASGNVTSAVSVQAGPDIVLIYGATDDASLATAAEGAADEVRRLQDGTR